VFDGDFNVLRAERAEIDRLEHHRLFRTPGYPRFRGLHFCRLFLTEPNENCIASVGG
jgi:hypothetical protein